MLLVALRKGGVKCSSACPYYQEDGVVRGINGPLQTHCRATMETVIVDCDVWNPHEIETVEVSEQQWQDMQRAIHKRAKKVRKQYDPNHKEIHPVGCEWTRSKGKWNKEKSKTANVK